ncbi:hypothetical protein D1604_07265 [Brevundimonas sp. LPMIX5]|nr:hypothetical protein D1604_07265 [Brevundimonas sp. LPMIX5]HBI19173.1 hypothetical protein [Brevundimonas sp.]
MAFSGSSRICIRTISPSRTSRPSAPIGPRPRAGPPRTWRARRPSWSDWPRAATAACAGPWPRARRRRARRPRSSPRPRCCPFWPRIWPACGPCFWPSPG